MQSSHCPCIVFNLFANHSRMRNIGREGRRTTSQQNVPEMPGGWRRIGSQSVQPSWSGRTWLWGRRWLNCARTWDAARKSWLAMKQNTDHCKRLILDDLCFQKKSVNPFHLMAKLKPLLQSHFAFFLIYFISILLIMLVQTLETLGEKKFLLKSVSRVMDCV